MGNNSSIEWTDATWNPVTGCTKVSPGCKHCYAERLWPKVEGARVKREGGAPRPFTDVRCHPDRLDIPLRWRTPKRVFVNSMSDLFHEDVPHSFIGDVFRKMEICSTGTFPARAKHTFQILTKRPERMLEYMRLYAHLHMGPPSNVWLGVSVEDQATADERIPLLLRTPAAVRFISAEPLLWPVDIAASLYRDRARITGEGGPVSVHDQPCLDWVIAGGESGPGARPSHPAWFRSLRDQCASAGVAFFFKQWGEWMPDKPFELHEGKLKRGVLIRADGTTPKVEDLEALKNGTFDYSGYRHMSAVGKKVAGRTLDGRTHDEYPTRDARE